MVGEAKLNALELTVLAGVAYPLRAVMESMTLALRWALHKLRLRVWTALQQAIIQPQNFW